MITTIDWTAIGTVLGGIATFLVLLVIPIAVLIHRKVLKPLRWILGAAAADSPTGEEILPVPAQLAEMRRTQGVLMKRTEELVDNGGNSIKDNVRKTHRLAVSTDKALRQHLIESATNEAAIWQSISGLTSQARDADVAAVGAAQLVQDQRKADHS